jgi:hypothetical protein
MISYSAWVLHAVFSSPLQLCVLLIPPQHQQYCYRRHSPPLEIGTYHGTDSLVRLQNSSASLTGYTARQAG